MIKAAKHPALGMPFNEGPRGTAGGGGGGGGGLSLNSSPRTAQHSELFFEAFIPISAHGKLTADTGGY